MKFLFNLSLLINFSRTIMLLLANFLDILCTLPFSTKQICPELPGTLPHHFLYTTLPVISLSQRQIPNQDDTEKWSLSLCSIHLNYFREQKLLDVFGWGLVEIINWVSSLLRSMILHGLWWNNYDFVNDRGTEVSMALMQFIFAHNHKEKCDNRLQNTFCLNYWYFRQVICSLLKNSKVIFLLKC